jgi:hypothetical protein
MQIWTAKDGGFVSSNILNLEVYCADILYEINGNCKGAYLIRQTEIKITCTKDYRWFEYVVLVNKFIASLRVKEPVFW